MVEIPATRQRITGPLNVREPAERHEAVILEATSVLAAIFGPYLGLTSHGATASRVQKQAFKIGSILLIT